MHVIACSKMHAGVHTRLNLTRHSQPAWLMLSSQFSRHTTSHSRAISPVHSQLHSMAYSQLACLYATKSTFTTLSITLPSMLSTTLPIALNCTLPAWTTKRSEQCSHDALNHSPEHALEYTPNCTRWHAPSLLDYTLPSFNQTSKNTSEYAPKYTSKSLPGTLSKWTTLANALDNILWWMLLHAQSRDHLSCTSHAPGGVRQEAHGGQCVAGNMWPVVCGRQREAYGGQNHDVYLYHSLNRICRMATATWSQDASYSWCWQL